MVFVSISAAPHCQDLRLGAPTIKSCKALHAGLQFYNFAGRTSFSTGPSNWIRMSTGMLQQDEEPDLALSGAASGAGTAAALTTTSCVSSLGKRLAYLVVLMWTMPPLPPSMLLRQPVWGFLSVRNRPLPVGSQAKSRCQVLLRVK